MNRQEMIAVVNLEDFIYLALEVMGQKQNVLVHLKIQHKDKIQLL